MSEDEKNGLIKGVLGLAKSQPLIAGMLLVIIVLELSSYYRAILRADTAAESEARIAELLIACIGANYPP